MWMKKLYSLELFSLPRAMENPHKIMSIFVLLGLLDLLVFLAHRFDCLKVSVAIEYHAFCFQSSMFVMKPRDFQINYAPTY
ncbi:hypothetical protein BIT28_15540 [Photobacterium proteolyticum]|uniref:Uncharacterized protein n=1 Tax=Photobacterium proteolyticum TaxID=1903952 RepID=A0A1Q9G905_9GAMM|nr:hypothetical protein BIT28_15540 [Photobacterium proteolyticum]